MIVMYLELICRKSRSENYAKHADGRMPANACVCDCFCRGVGWAQLMDSVQWLPTSSLHSESSQRSTCLRESHFLWELLVDDCSPYCDQGGLWQKVHWFTVFPVEKWVIVVFCIEKYLTAFNIILSAKGDMASRRVMWHAHAEGHLCMGHQLSSGVQCCHQEACLGMLFFFSWHGAVLAQKDDVLCHSRLYVHRCTLAAFQCLIAANDSVVIGTFC